MASFFTEELEGVATFWRIHRRDGVTQGFTSHDRDLAFGGINHRAAPGMQPTAVRRTNDLASDEAEVKGALNHDSIAATDLAAGLYDHAQISIGAVNWETLEQTALYTGTIGEVESDGYAFGAELRSAKAELEKELVPRTSPTCRAAFCGKQCGLSRARFLSHQTISSVDADSNSVSIELANFSDYVGGELRFLDGPQTGLVFGIMSADANSVTLDRPLVADDGTARPALLMEGCDRTIETCTNRFSNAASFRGEPFLPGNDLLARYPIGR